MTMQLHAASRESSVTQAELDAVLARLAPEARLVAPRLLRRIIQHDRRMTGVVVWVPHRKTYVIAGASLARLVEPSELNVDFGGELPETVLLIARPTAEQCAAVPRGAMLLRMWRLLAHARIDWHLQRRVNDGALSEAVAHERLEQIGAAEFDEIRNVLRQENFLLPPRDDRSTYIEFAAVYAELRHFAPSLVPVYFPGLALAEHVDAIVAQDVDAEAIISVSRPADAAEPTDVIAELPVDVEASGPRPPLPHRIPQPRQFRKLLEKANNASARGNDVRAAILRTLASRYDSSEEGTAAFKRGVADLQRVVARLESALGLEPADVQHWRTSVVSLLSGAVRGFWSVEARLLYDLQKVCVDHERTIYKLDPVEWVLSRFSGEPLPLRRFLPSQREVLMSKHLRSAARRLRSVRVGLTVRKRLEGLLERAVERAENLLRMRLRDRIGDAIAEQGPAPANLPERVAQQKVVEELLDRIVARGFLTIGDVRDTLSRNNLKLPDVSNPYDFVRGDHLLRVDKRLASSLDGVYHRGEIYLRLPQRLSSLGFGTAPGRFLTRFVVLPFGGAYLIIEGLKHLLEHLFFKAATQGSHFRWEDALAVFALGMFLLGLIHQKQFRESCLAGVKLVLRVLRLVLIDTPRWLLRQPLIRAVFESRTFWLFYRYMLRPAVFSLVVLVPLWLVLGQRPPSINAFGIFIGLNLLLNSRLGRSVDEWVSDWLARSWHRLRIHVFAALYRLIMDAFHQLLEWIDQALYTVDEWLRFKSGESGPTTVLKAGLGIVWYFVNYLVRLLVTVLIEPQINPIKHFPVVSVSHKILLPLTPQLSRLLPLGSWSLVTATTIVLLTPGAIGFLVWELKENWRLYAANRSPKLLPVQVGRHAETVGQLLRPGFHSGTIAKLFGRLRRARRKVQPGGNWTSVFKCEAGLEEVRESMRQFVERELLALLHMSKAPGVEQVGVGRVSLSTNSIHIELQNDAAPRDSAWIRFEEQSGWLLGSLRPAGWLANLPDEERYHWFAALTGLYKMAGVDLLREQIEAQLGGWAESYNLCDEGLLVWPRGSGWQPVLYRLIDDPELRAESPDGGERVELPVLERAAVVFSDQPLSWAAWVTTWQRSPGAWTTANERPPWWRAPAFSGVAGSPLRLPVTPLGEAP